MIEIFAHRGLWSDFKEQNTLSAIENAFKLGLNLETDIRDLNGNLVISHDPAIEMNRIDFKHFLEIKEDYPDLLVALNIKSDGLSQSLIDVGLQSFSEEYLLFDGSFPTMRTLKHDDFKCLERLSEYEQKSNMRYDGFWVDAFENDWFMDSDEIIKIINQESSIAIFVSPELHKREHIGMWQWLKNNQEIFETKIGLCTDLPIIARNYFE